MIINFPLQRIKRTVPYPCCGESNKVGYHNGKVTGVSDTGICETYGFLKSKIRFVNEFRCWTCGYEWREPIS
ncbi:MAG TPA: hypothetical protein DCW90_03315 [Lachnospiraceae bacterium]|nr:hypothetical protein [Lachnospiraceae bacterium]